MPDVLRVVELVRWAAAHYPCPRPPGELLARFGLEGLSRRQFGGLSGGQKRRLTVALAFAGDPDAVLCGLAVWAYPPRPGPAVHVRVMAA